MCVRPWVYVRVSNVQASSVWNDADGINQQKDQRFCVEGMIDFASICFHYLIPEFIIFYPRSGRDRNKTMCN